MATVPIPVGVALSPIGVDAGWWLRSAQRLEAAGFASVWAWDHFVSRGRLTDPVLECWTLLAAAAATTHRIGLGSFVVNVMNRHPAVLAREVATVAAIAPGRLALGIGSGGHPAEHLAYGIPFPPVAERAAHLEDAVATIRLLLSGGPVTRESARYPLAEAHAFPVPEPAVPVVVAGMTPAGTRLAARIGDAWTGMDDAFDRDYPTFLAALAAAGRRRAEVSVIVGVATDRTDGGRADPLLADLAAGAAAWQARGADAIVLREVRPAELEAVLAAGERAGLARSPAPGSPHPVPPPAR